MDNEELSRLVEGFVDQEEAPVHINILLHHMTIILLIHAHHIKLIYQMGNGTNCHMTSVSDTYNVT